MGSQAKVYTLYIDKAASWSGCFYDNNYPLLYQLSTVVLSFGLIRMSGQLIIYDSLYTLASLVIMICSVSSEVNFLCMPILVKM